MTIEIENLTFKCIIGILDFERTQQQDVIINATLEYVYDKHYIDYAAITKLYKNEMTKQKFFLLEDAIEHLIQKTHDDFPTITSITLKISKPSILSDAIVSVCDAKRFNS